MLSYIFSFLYTLIRDVAYFNFNRDILNRFILLVAMLLFISFFISVGILHKIGAQITMPLPSISNSPAVRITFPHHFDNVSLTGPLNISGISSDNELTDCKVSVIVNNVKPYQNADASR